MVLVKCLSLFSLLVSSSTCPMIIFTFYYTNHFVSGCQVATETAIEHDFIDTCLHPPAFSHERPNSTEVIRK